MGGLIGGFFAAGAVWLTLRHERRMTDLAAARALASQVAAKTWSMKGLAAKEAWTPGDIERVVEFSLLVGELSALLNRRWLHAAIVLEVALASIRGLLENPTGGDDSLLHVSEGVGGLCRKWIGDATYFEDPWYVRAIHWRPTWTRQRAKFERRLRWYVGFQDGDFSLADLEPPTRKHSRT